MGALIMAIVYAGPVLIDRSDKQFPGKVETFIEHSYKDYSDGDTFQRVLASDDKFKLPASPKFKSYSIECDLWNESFILDSLTFNFHELVNPSKDAIWIYGEDRVSYNEVKCINEVRINMTDVEMELVLDEWHESRMKDIIEVREKRETPKVREVTREGDVTLKRGR